MSRIDTEFREFESGKARVPRELSERVRGRIHGLLHPSVAAVLGRLGLVHLASALVTLSVCPQFGVRVAGEGMGLMHWFMGLGDLGCAIACGAVFLGTSGLAAGLLLRPEEVRVIRRHRVLELGSLSLGSLGVFIMLNPAGIVATFAAAWVFGSLLGAAALLEAAWALRTKLG
jgi:hypothetical protein